MKKLHMHPNSSSVSTVTPQPAKKFLPPVFVLLSISSTQVGAALAKGLFPALGPIGTVGLRVGWAALLLILLWRSRLFGSYNRTSWRLVGLFGLVLAAMNLSFYLALSQIPLGVTVTLEFAGPLLLAIAQSRRIVDLLWALLATTGILLLMPVGDLGPASVNLLGIGLALLAGACWAAYVLLSARIGKDFPGGVGLAYATSIAALVLLPLSIFQARAALLNPTILAIGAGVGLLSTALPYSLEMEALRHLPSRVFSILLSVEPMIAALAGFAILHEALTLRTIVASLLISIASVAVVSSQKSLSD